MADLRDEVPPIDPDKDALGDYALIAVDALVPVVGGVLADLSRGMLARRTEERQHAFNVLVAAEITRLSEQPNGPTAATIVESDEFMAAFSAASRVAAETASESKRSRLARVMSHMGPWDTLQKDRRAQLFALAIRYTDLHVFLLRYFRDPPEWLRRHAPRWQAGQYMMAGIDTVLAEHVFVASPGWQETVKPVLGDFTADGLAQVPLGSTMSDEGTVQKRTSSLGDEFLHFLGSNDDSSEDSLPQ